MALSPTTSGSAHTAPSRWAVHHMERVLTSGVAADWPVRWASWWYSGQDAVSAGDGVAPGLGDVPLREGVGVPRGDAEGGWPEEAPQAVSNADTTSTATRAVLALRPVLGKSARLLPLLHRPGNRVPLRSLGIDCAPPPLMLDRARRERVAFTSSAA